MLFGALMVILGAVGYFITDMTSLTALIPSFFGLALIILGFVASKGERARMHAMHAAAMLALLGLVGGVVMTVRIAGASPERQVAIGENVLFALLCAVFLGLCVKSFIDARKARRARAAQPPRTDILS